MPLIYGALLFALGQSLIWIQTNGQFVWPWFKNNPLIISIVGGSMISYIFIMATRYTVDYFDGFLWPTRFINFAVGIIVFGFFTCLFLGEGINTKTAISLILSVALLCVQIFWK